MIDDHILCAFAIAMLLCITPSDSLEMPFAFTMNTAGLENMSSNQLTDIYNNSHHAKKISKMEDSLGSPYRKTYGPIFEEKIRFSNVTTWRIAHEIIRGHPGDLTLDQVLAIYDYLRYGSDKIGGWYYVSDPMVLSNESDSFRSASENLANGEKMNFTGSGDCDDFAIAIASLLKEIGGTVRIIVVEDHGNPVHAYSEVYLGSLNETDNEIYYLTQLLMMKYRVDKIYTHIDPVNKEVWLNLDTSLSLGEQAYPGIPYSEGAAHHLIVDFTVPDSKKGIKPPEYRSMINILNESMNSPEGIGELRAIDKNLLLVSILAQRSGSNASEIPSTDEFVGAAYDLLGSYGVFDVDMAKFAYGNVSSRPNSSGNLTNPILSQMINSMMTDKNASEANTLLGLENMLGN